MMKIDFFSLELRIVRSEVKRFSQYYDVHLFFM